MQPNPVSAQLDKTSNNIPGTNSYNTKDSLHQNVQPNLDPKPMDNVTCSIPIVEGLITKESNSKIKALEMTLAARRNVSERQLKIREETLQENAATSNTIWKKVNDAKQNAEKETIEERTMMETKLSMWHLTKSKENRTTHDMDSISKQMSNRTEIKSLRDNINFLEMKRQTLLEQLNDIFSSAQLYEGMPGFLKNLATAIESGETDNNILIEMVQCIYSKTEKHHWNDSIKTLYSTILNYGGPSCHEILRQNLNGPSLSTSFQTARPEKHTTVAVTVEDIDLENAR